MKKILLPLLLSFLVVNTLQAKIWRVNNQVGIPADFTNGQDAHNAASAGDTLSFESSPTYYTGFTIRKQLTVLGMGSYLSTYSGYQMSVVNVSSYDIYIKPGASGTIISGIQANTVYADSVGNITINRVLGNVYFKKVNNSQITKIYGQVEIRNSASIILNNNILIGITLFSSDNTFMSAYNNYINQFNNAYNATISNNFIRDGSFQNCSVTYNVFHAGSYMNNGVTFFSGGNNLFSKSSSNVFIESVPDDRAFQLKAGSPAIGASSTGGDCGPSGGANPYIFNGMQPEIPSIYKLAVPGVVTGNTMPVTISTRSN